MNTIIVIVLLVVVIALAMLFIAKYRQGKMFSGGAMKKTTRPRGKKIPVGGPREGLKVQKELDLPVTKLDAGAITKAISEIESIHTGFGPVTDADIKKFGAVAKSLKLDPSVVEKLSNIVVSGKIAQSVSNVIAASDEIVAASASGKTIVDIANEKSMPPIAVARQILLTRGNNLQKIREMLQGKEKLPDDLAEQVADAAKLDHSSSINMDAIKAVSAKHEATVAAWLKKNKVAFKTEEQLRAEQTANPQFGKPIATPDFFFEEPVKINGELVNWLEAKDWPLFESEGPIASRMLRSLTQQAIKYNRHFGRGAFIFSCGIVDGVKLSTDKGPIDAVLLSGP